MPAAAPSIRVRQPKAAKMALPRGARLVIGIFKLPVAVRAVIVPYKIDLEATIRTDNVVDFADLPMATSLSLKGAVHNPARRMNSMFLSSLPHPDGDRQCMFVVKSGLIPVATLRRAPVWRPGGARAASRSY
ncbi:MAG TPA: hypothetical protein VF800_11645 [Telluria sp.]|jgi:hypothetical protein